MAKHPHARLSFFLLLIAFVVLVQRSHCSGPSSPPVLEPAPAQVQERAAAAVVHGDVDQPRRGGGEITSTMSQMTAGGRSAVKELVVLIGGRGADQVDDDGTPPSSPVATTAAAGGDDVDGPTSTRRRRSAGAGAGQIYAVPYLKLARRFLAGGQETVDSAVGPSCRSNNAHITCSPAAPH